MAKNGNMMNQKTQSVSITAPALVWQKIRGKLVHLQGKQYRNEHAYGVKVHEGIESWHKKENDIVHVLTKELGKIEI